MKQVSFVLMAALVLIGCFSLKTLAADRRVDNIKDGTYRIKAINGNEKGKYLYYKEDETDVKKQLQFTSNTEEPNAQWVIKQDTKHTGCYFIYLKNKSPYRISMDKPTGTTAVYCIMPERAENLFCFYRRDDSTDYNNLTISPFYNKDFRLTRTNESGKIFVNAIKSDNLTNRSWKLEAVGKETNDEVIIRTKTLKVKASKVKKKSQTIALSKAITVNNISGDAKFKISPKASSKAKKYFKIDKTGKKIVVKKGTKKGTYKVKLIVTAIDSSDKEVSKNTTLTVKVK